MFINYKNENIENKIIHIEEKYNNKINKYTSEIKNIKTEKAYKNFLKKIGEFKSDFIQEILNINRIEKSKPEFLKNIENIVIDIFNKYNEMGLYFYKITDKLEFNQLVRKEKIKLKYDNFFKDIILPEHKKLYRISKNFNDKFKNFYDKKNYFPEEFETMERMFMEYQKQISYIGTNKLIAYTFEDFQNLQPLAITNDITSFKFLFYQKIYQQKLIEQTNIQKINIEKDFQHLKENKEENNSQEINKLNKDFLKNFIKFKNMLNQKNNKKNILKIIEEIDTTIIDKENYFNKSNQKKLEEFNELKNKINSKQENKIDIKPETTYEKNEIENNQFVNIDNKNIKPESIYEKNEFSIYKLEKYIISTMLKYTNEKNIKENERIKDILLNEEILLWLNCNQITTEHLEDLELFPSGKYEKMSEKEKNNLNKKTTEKYKQRIKENINKIIKNKIDIEINKKLSQTLLNFENHLIKDIENKLEKSQNIDLQENLNNLNKNLTSIIELKTEMNFSYIKNKSVLFFQEFDNYQINEFLKNIEHNIKDFIKNLENKFMIQKKYYSVILRFKNNTEQLLNSSKFDNKTINEIRKNLEKFENFLNEIQSLKELENIKFNDLFEEIKEKQLILQTKEKQLILQTKEREINFQNNQKSEINVNDNKIKDLEELLKEKQKIEEQLLFKENNKKILKNDLEILGIYKKQYNELENGVSEIKKRFDIIFNEEIEDIDRVKTFEKNFENLRLELSALIEQINSENFYSEKIKNKIKETVKNKYENLIKEIENLEKEYEELYELAKEEYEDKLKEIENQKELEILAAKNVEQHIKEEIQNTINSGITTPEKEELKEKVKTNEVIITYTSNKKIVKELDELNTNNKEVFQSLYKIILNNNINSVQEFNDKFKNNEEIQKYLGKNKDTILNSLFYFKDGQKNKTYTIDFMKEQMDSEIKEDYLTELLENFDLPLNNYALQFEKTVKFIDFNEKTGKIIEKKIDEIFISINEKTKSLNLILYFIDNTKTIFENINIMDMKKFFNNHLNQKLDNINEYKKEYNYSMKDTETLFQDLKNNFSVKEAKNGFESFKKSKININEDLMTLVFNSMIELIKEKELLLNDKEKEVYDLSKITSKEIILKNNNNNEKKDISEVDKKLKKICTHIIPVKGHYKAQRYGKNNQNVEIIWIKPFYKNTNDLINADFIKSEREDEEQFKTPILSDKVSIFNKENILKENEKAKKEKNEEKAASQAERLVLKILQYYQPNGKYHKKSNQPYNINHIKNEIQKIKLNTFVENELKEYLVSNLEKSEKDQKLIINDSLILIDYINNKFSNGFKIEDLNDGKNEKGYDYKVYDIKNEIIDKKEILSISYKFKDGRSWYNPSMEAFTNILVKKGESIVDEWKKEMDNLTKQIDKKMKRFTNIDDIIIEIYQNLKEELLENYTNDDIKTAFDKIQKMDKPDYIIFNNEEFNEKIPIKTIIKENKKYSDFYDQSVFKIIKNYIKKIKNGQTNKEFKEYIKEINYLTQNSIVSNNLDETKYIIEDLYTNTEFNKTWKKILNKDKTIGEEYHEKLNNVMSKFIIKQYEMINKDNKLKEKILTNILHLQEGQNVIIGKNKIIELPNKDLTIKHLKDIEIIINKNSFKPTNSGIEFDMKVMLGNIELFVFNKNTIKTKSGSMRGTLSVDMSSTKNMDIIENINEVLKNYKSGLEQNNNLQ
jgi:hypothetical protein